MSLRIRALVSIVTLSSLALFVACGSNSVTRGTPPPSGAFSNSNLNGTYVFAVTGSDSQTGAFQTIAGTFAANGSGAITGGTLELYNPILGSVPPTPITSGNYSVGADGRGGLRNGGGMTLQTSAGTFSFQFVLSSTQHGLLTEFDLNGTGSGTLDMQSSVSQSSIANQSYAFSLTGVDSTGQVGFGTVGALTLDANGNVVTGLADFNENGNSLVCGQPLLTACSVTGGSINLSTVPGTATFVSSNSSLGTLTFDVYPVDSTHLKFIEKDGLAFSAGDAFTQSSSIPAANYVFTVAGFDSISVPQGPFTSAGIVATDGSGGITNASIQDINDVGVVPANPIPFTGSYSTLTGGRSVLTLTGFVNGNNGAGCNTCQFAAYPSSGGVQLLEIDNAGTTAGVAYPQSATSLASGEGYGMNLTGINTVEEDDIAEFVNTNGNFAGLIDFNDAGSLSPALHFSSTYTTDSTVPGRGVVTAGNNAFNLVSYVVDGSTSVFVETDSNQVGIGSFALQNATASSNVAATHLKVLRLLAATKKAAKRR